MTAGVGAPPWPRVIGHRGAAGAAPENTLAGFRRAAALGVRAVELDVRLSGDGLPILLHDDTLERTTDGAGAAAALPFAAIRRLDAGGWFGVSFRGERVPSLEEAVAVLSELGLGAVVELKPAAREEAATARAALAVLARLWPSSLPLVVSSFRPTALAAAREAVPAIARALLVEDLAGDWRGEAAALGCAALHVGHRALDAAAAAAVGAAGLTLLAFTVNEPSRARALLGWGVAAVFTDYPDRLAEAGLEHII